MHATCTWLAHYPHTPLGIEHTSAWWSVHVLTPQHAPACSNKVNKKAGPPFGTSTEPSQSTDKTIQELSMWNLGQLANLFSSWCLMTYDWLICQHCHHELCMFCLEYFMLRGHGRCNLKWNLLRKSPSKYTKTCVVHLEATSPRSPLTKLPYGMLLRLLHISGETRTSQNFTAVLQ